MEGCTDAVLTEDTIARQDAARILLKVVLDHMFLITVADACQEKHN